MSARIEYLGFYTGVETRDYRLRVIQDDGSFQDFTVAIMHAAFRDKRVRYQDGAEISYLKLRTALLGCGEAKPATHHDVSDADLAAYVEAHTPKPSTRRRARPAAAEATGDAAPVVAE